MAQLDALAAQRDAPRKILILSDADSWTNPAVDDLVMDWAEQGHVVRWAHSVADSKGDDLDQTSVPQLDRAFPRPERFSTDASAMVATFGTGWHTPSRYEALLQNGWVKAKNFRAVRDKGADRYLITPSGIEAKARLSQRNAYNWAELNQALNQVGWPRVRIRADLNPLSKSGGLLNDRSRSRMWESRLSGSERGWATTRAMGEIV